MIIYSKVIEAPESEPVTLEEAKIHLNLESDFTDHDAMIAVLIKAARRLCESYTGRSFVTQVRSMRMDRFPCVGAFSFYNNRRRNDGMIVPYGPVQSIDSIIYLDEDGNEQSLTIADDVNVDLDSALCRIYPTDTWPSISDSRMGILVTYTAGYDPVSGGTEEFPEEAKQAMLMIIGSLYENRQDEVIGTSVNIINWTSQKLLDPLKVYWNAETEN